MPAADQNQTSARCDDADRGTGNTPQFDRIRELRKTRQPRVKTQSRTSASEKRVAEPVFLTKITL